MKYSRCLALLATTCLCAQSIATPVSQREEERPLPFHVRLREERRAQWRERNPEDLQGREAEAHKYFHEPSQDDMYGHYDRRFFHGIVSYDQRSDALKHLIRSYLRFFADNGLETWIAHGTLLGWWWNGRKLPWDSDLDTQVSDETLTFLAKHMNFTTYQYRDNVYDISREYLLDINPYYLERERGDGMNIIDARWVDIRNGLYIDITGLSETMPQTFPGVWSCKNYHHYLTKDLYPMRESTFEGMPAKIPYAYDKILIEEYTEKALTLTEYEGHYWDSDRREWIQRQQTNQGHRKNPKEPKTPKRWYEEFLPADDIGL